jgi:maltose/maltodextrin transport system substrate-binding protein
MRCRTNVYRLLRLALLLGPVGLAWGVPIRILVEDAEGGAAWTQALNLAATRAALPAPQRLAPGARGAAPDAWCGPTPLLAERFSAGELEPLSTDAVQRLTSRMHPMAVQGLRRNGRVWAYPLALDAPVLIFRADRMGEAPRTFDAVAGIAARARARGATAMAWPFGDANLTWPWLAAGGGYTFALNEDGTPDERRTGIDHAGAVQGLTQLAGWRADGVVRDAPDPAQRIEALARGALWMTVDHARLALGVRDLGAPVRLAPLPGIDGRPASPMVTVWGCAVRTGGPQAAAAHRLLAALSEDAQALAPLFKTVRLGVPALDTLRTQRQAVPDFAAVARSVDDGWPMPMTVAMRRIWSALARALPAALAGRQSSAQSLKEAAARVRG